MVNGQPPVITHSWLRVVGGVLCGRSLLLLFLLALSACASLPREVEPNPPQTALPPTVAGSLALLEQNALSPETSGQSGFHLLDKNMEALKWRLALLDEATHSLDLMYYLWYGDDSGRLLLKRAIQAADRGVKVRFIIDDMLLIGEDKTLVALQAHPNIQLRIFNPWYNRKLGLGLEFVGRMDELNTRMHNKLMIADNHVMIAGGRNIGDHYFGLHPTYNFHDLDVLGVGPVARQGSDMFDSFWNSTWVVSAEVLPAQNDAKFAKKRSRRLLESLNEAESLTNFELEPRSWQPELENLTGNLRLGSSDLIYDHLDGELLIQGMPALLTEQLNSAEQEILLVNAYVVPGQTFIDGISALSERGVSIRILTNSLESHDVPAVNSHYKQWRKPILAAGAELYELRADPEIKSHIDTPPVVSGFSGLHTKSFVVDRTRVFIGSMNLDPRSANINTEMGLTIDSPALAKDLARLAERDMSPDNAWQVSLDNQGRLIWTSADETVTRQPARNTWQRFMDKLFRLLPRSQM